MPPQLQIMSLDHSLFLRNSSTPITAPSLYSMFGSPGSLNLRNSPATMNIMQRSLVSRRTNLSPISNSEVLKKFIIAFSSFLSKPLKKALIMAFFVKNSRTFFICDTVEVSLMQGLYSWPKMLQWNTSSDFLAASSKTLKQACGFFLDSLLISP